MPEKPFVLKLSVFDEASLPFFLGGNINTTLLKKTTHEANEELKVVRKLCKEYVNNCKNALQSTIKSKDSKTDEEKSQQSRYDALNVKYERLVNNHLQIEAQCVAKKTLIDLSKNKNFNSRKAELKNNLAALEKEWIIQKEAVKRNHLQNFYECKFFDEFLNCKFLVKTPSEVEFQLHPGYYFTLRHIGENKWTLVEISPKTFAMDKYSRKFEQTENLPFLVASLRKRLLANWSTSDQNCGDTRSILTTRALEN
ncbi:hypothetical protein LSTR_LSTR002310 [Laodelphax striatellus]|uniref:Kinetochore protein SPC25 n=1 Tax=Laodelphax striatellus TaxID=195883 RepID=A0A482XFM4_LAOST|nr:hypothetical protein LSTR_LSTR002310 [Laodelphax striatellus]